MNNALIDIIRICLKLEGQAIRVYRAFSEQSDGKLKAFWIRMKDQEREHIQYWRSLLELAEKGEIRNIFDDPMKIIVELNAEAAKAVKLVNQALKTGDTTERFLAAYRLEFIMFHPAFEAMFYLMRAQTGDQSPSDGYLNHINQLINMIRELGDENPELELLADLSVRLWNQNHVIAEQLANIREMRGLVPICMHCKNIRDDDGFWQKVEKYVEGHSHAEFSHGVCPSCLRKYYGDVFTEADFEELEKGN